MQQVERVTVTEAAARLGVNKSTISRQVRTLGIPVDHDKRFDLSALEAARSEVHSPLNARGQVGGAASPAVAGRLASEQADLKSVERQLKQLDLDERLGKLVDRAEMAASIQAAGRQLRDVLVALPQRLAPRLVSIDQPAVAEQILSAAIGEALDAAAEAMDRLASAPGDA